MNTWNYEYTKNKLQLPIFFKFFFSIYTYNSKNFMNDGNMSKK